MKIFSGMQVGRDMHMASQDTIKMEPMLHRANLDFAIKNGSFLTHTFLSSLGLTWNLTQPILIDSRVHMLMPGMWPCIPGWHHDDVPRTRSDNQPNYDRPEYSSEHCMALWGNCSLTEFAIGEADFELPPIGSKIYKEWDPVVEEYCNDKVLKRVTAPEAKLIFFNCHTWHRGMPTNKFGFRFFIRATRNSMLPAKNEIRYNANVYMPILEEGW